jgi:hypothetical protein
MGCGKPKLPANGTIVPLTVKVAPKKVESKRPKITIRNDHHCPTCGYTGPHERHNCKGKKKIGYVETRKSWCGRCRYNTDDVCTLYKSLHPDRDAVISVGVEIPYAACPAGFWPKVLMTCPRCNAVTFNESGAMKCKSCGYSEARVCRLPFVITDKKETPLEAKGDLLVVTIAAGQKSLDLLELTGPQMEKYAAKVGASFHTITDDLYPEYPLANKFRLKNLVSNYKRVLFLDVDVWVRSHADDLFRFVPIGSVGIHRDYEHLASTDWVAGEAERKAKQQQVEPIDLQILNTGVVLFDAEHTAMWTPPPLPCKAAHLTEQTQVEYNIAHAGLPVHKLKLRHNTQWWMQSFKMQESSAHFLHLANCPHEERLYRFRKLSQTEKQSDRTTL